MKGLFTKASLQRHKGERSVVRNVSGETLEEHAPGTSEDLWTNDPIGSGLKSTQQLLIDWSDYAQHVFFNSAEAKVNMAFDDIINGYPFDGTSAEKAKFLADIGGFTKHVLDQIDTNLGYLNFRGGQYIQSADVTGYEAQDLARSIGKSLLSKNLHTKGTTVEFWINKPTTPSAADTNPHLIYQKKKSTDSSRGVSIWESMNGNLSTLVLELTAQPVVGQQLVIKSSNIQTQFGGNDVTFTFDNPSLSDASISAAGAATIKRSATLSDMAEDISRLLNTVSGYTATVSSSTITLVSNFIGSDGDITYTATSSAWHNSPSAPTPSGSTLDGNYCINFMISSDNFKSISLSSEALEYNTWYHIAFTYERATTERVRLYINGELSKSTTNSQAELDDIQLPDGTLKIGGSSTALSTCHNSYANDTGVLGNFKGYLDEFRVWLGVRTAEQIKSKYQKNVDASPELLLNYRFNEPYTTDHTVSPQVIYNAENYVLDYSGNSYHSKISGYQQATSTAAGTRLGTQRDTADMPESRTWMKYEKEADNPILFPDWLTTTELNKNMVISGNHYDRNNPNLITKLIPDHYFEEAQYFEGIDVDFETPMQNEFEDIMTPKIPGRGKLPPRVVMLSFLLVWANHFDDIKLYLDSFSLLNKVTYDTYNQIPPQVIMFLADYYGIDLPNPYANESVSKFKFGESIEADSSYGTPLSTTLDLMWRRVLVNLPYLLRSRGTVQGIRALINTLGIEADSTFRFREFGGSITKQIATSRIKKKKKSKVLDFSKMDYFESEGPLWAFRHEPGAPDPGLAGSPSSPPCPTIGKILFQSGDITIVEPGSGPVATTFTSGSWAWEGRYQLLPTETTASLFRIEQTDSANQQTLVNLVAMRAEDGKGVDFNLRLFVDGFNTTSQCTVLDLPGVNLWDGKPWYISVSNEYSANETDPASTDVYNTVHVNCIKQTDTYISEHYSGSIQYKRASAAAAGAVRNNGLPLFEIDTTTDAAAPFKGLQTPPTLNYCVGTKPSTTYNTPAFIINDASGTALESVATDFDGDGAADGIESKKEQAVKTNYSGKLSHMRFWTKHLTKREQVEHAQNPFSVHVKQPVNASAFPGANVTRLNTSTGKYETQPVSKVAEQFEGSLPQGSWERLRQHFDMLQPDITFDGAGKLVLTSSIPLSDDIEVYGTANSSSGLEKQEFIYTLAPPDFDSNASENKVRIRAFADKETADLNYAHHGTLSELPYEVGVDDRRFSIESSLVHALNEDIVNMLGDSTIMNNYLGAPELEYAVEYPEVKKVMDLYFQRLTGKVKYNAIIEFQRWFNNNFASLVEQFIPHTADFLGINFVVESHVLERHKMEYKQGDVHVDIRDRQAFSQEPLFLGTIRSEIT